VINTNHEQQGIRLEEYFEHGKRHRPSAEGPAILLIGSDGKLVQESYHEMPPRSGAGTGMGRSPGWRAYRSLYGSRQASPV
jgi:hypothetical protein